MVTHEPDIAEQTERIIHIRDGVVERDEQNLAKSQAAVAALRSELHKVQEGSEQ
jgi:ABC-type lipoprotein export system ATPase subunit